MNKTKLGVSDNAYACLTFLAGLTGFLGVAILTGVAFIMGESDWLKKTTFKALVFVLFMSALGGIVACLNDGVSFFVNLVKLFDSGFNFSIPSSIISLLRTAVSFFTSLGLLVFASKAYKGRYIKIAKVEEFTNNSL